MAEGVGYLAIGAIGEETTVNIAVNAVQRIRNLEFAPAPEFGLLADMSLQGQVAQATPELGMMDIRGAWRCYDTYTLGNLILKHFLGNLAGGVYTFADSLVGHSLTWAVDKTVSVWEFSGMKINQLVLHWTAEAVELSGTAIAQGISFNSLTYTASTISADSTDNSINDTANLFPAFVPGDKVTIQGFTGGGVSNNGVGIVVSRTASKIIVRELPLTTATAGTAITVYGGANTQAELAALLPNVDTRMKIAPDLSTRLGLYSGALAATDEIKAIEGTLTMTRPMAEQHVNGQRSIYEPAPNNFVTATLALTLPRFNTNQYELWKATRQRLSVRIYFAREGGGGSQEWTLPNVVLRTTPSPVNGPGFFPQTLTADVSIGQDKVGPGTTFSAATADNSFNDSANGFPMLYPGGRVFSTGFTNAVNNGSFTVVSRTAGKIVVSGATLTTEAAGPTVTLVTRNPFLRIVET